MDSISDLSLLEIAAEDDSLLLDTPASTDVFACSPLLSLRSNPRLTEGNGSGAVDSENSANKENANWSKPELLKLSVERQQMKRKKKGGGYNLRKSLAWDRAFFTEQGVLNARELSMISGTATSNAELNLEVIQEEEPVSTSLGLQEIEENLFKQSSDSVPIKDKKIIAGSGLYLKHDASAKDSPAPASLAKRKVLAVNDVIGNRSKRSACPRPLASSLRRPDQVKAPSREMKVTRIPGPKPNVSVRATTARSGTLGMGSSKRNSNARPVSTTNVQKNAGVKSLSKNPKIAQSNPKVDQTDNCSVGRTLTKQDGKHLDNSVSEMPPTSRMHQPGTGENKASERLPQVLSETAKKRQQTQFQTTKPSGLRMPSPSLGFFSQAKTMGQLQKSSKVCKPAENNIPKLKKSETVSVNETRLPHAPRKRPEIVEGAAKNRTKKLSRSEVKSEPCMQVENEQMADAVVECNSLVFENISKQERVENIPEHVGIKSDEQGELHKSENVSSMEDASFPIHEKKLLSKSVTHEQSEKEADQPSMQVDTKQMADVEVGCNSSGFERISKQEKVEQGELHVDVKSDEQGELHKSENVSSMEDVSFPIHEKKLLSKSLTREQSEQEADQPSMQVDTKQMADVEVGGNSSGCERISKQEKVEQGELHVGVKSDEQDELHKSENVSSMEDVSFSIHEKKLLSKSLTHEQSEKEADRPSMPVDNKQVADVEVECSSLGFERISKQEKVENIIEPVSVKSKEQGEVHKSDNVSSVQNVSFSRHEKTFLSKSLTHVQLEEEADHNLDDKAYDVLSSGDQSVFQEPHSMPYHGNHQISIGKDCVSNTVLYNAMGQDEEEQIKVVACDILDANGSSVQQAKHGASKDSRDSGEFKESSSVKNALLNCSLIDFSGAILGGSIKGISCKSTEQVHGGTGDFGVCKGDAQVHLLNGNLSVNCNETTQSNLEAVNQQLRGEQLMTPNPSIVGEISSEKENESHVNSFQQVHVTTLSSKGSPENSIPEIRGASESESKLVETEDCQLPVDSQSGFIQIIPMDEGYDDQAIDSEAVDDRTQVFELDRLSEDSTAVSATACCTEVLNVSSENRPFCDENNIENNLHLISKLCPLDKADCDSWGNEPHVNSCQLDHVTNLSSKGSSQMALQEMKGASELVETEDCQAIPMDEGYDQVIDSKAVDDTTQAFESDRLSADCTSVSATACCTKVMKVSLKNSPFCENNIDSLHLTSQLCPMVKAVCDARGNDMSFNNCCAISELQLRGDGSSRDTSMHCDVQHNVPGNREQQASMFTFSETNEMLREGESLVPNHGQLIDQSEFSEASTDFISNPKNSSGSRAENPSSLSKHTLLAHSVQEFDHINREIEESLVEGAQVKSSNEEPVVHNCTNEHSLAVNQVQFSLAGDNNMNEDSHLSMLQRASAVVIVDSQDVDNILCFDGEWLPTDVASSEEIKKKNVFEDASEGCNIHTSEHNTSNHHIQAVPENKDGNLDVGERAELLQMDGAKGSSFDMLSSVELHNVIFDEFDSSEKVNKDPWTEEVEKSEEHCFLSETSNLPASDCITFKARIPQGSEDNSLNSEKISDEYETIIFEKGEFPNTGMQDKTEGDIDSAEGDIHLSTTKSKQEAPTVKPPPNAAPFSDEWLAAIEAAGEEILTIKSGPVQNSPPEKPQHEPGPWSPVKRKNQAIGPFDCTKHTNIPHSSSQ